MWSEKGLRCARVLRRAFPPSADSPPKKGGFSDWPADTHFIHAPAHVYMSLYHEAAKLLERSRSEQTSLKSLVYGSKIWNSEPKALFALSTEAAKWSEILSEVVEKSGLLKVERQVSRSLAVFVVDHGDDFGHLLIGCRSRRPWPSFWSTIFLSRNEG